MSVRKLLVLTAASLAAISASAAMAGGPDHMATSMPSEAAFQNSIYVDLQGGHESSNWTNFNGSRLIGPASSSLYSVTGKRGKGFWTPGVDLGYNITQHIAAEAGWFYQFAVHSTNSGTTPIGGVTPTASNLNVKSWFAYLAGRLNVPVVDNFDLFGKVGVAYRDLSYSTNSTNLGVLALTGNGFYWAPVFGTGLQYNWGNWLFGAQYMYLPGNSEANLTTAGGNVTSGVFGAPDAAPAIHTYTAFVGYHFAV